MTQSTIRLTMAQALARFLTRQMTEIDGQKVPIFGGVFAIFGHGNVAGLGEALYQVRDVLPTYRGHNEQSMAHAAIGFAKASFRRRMMVATSSIGPGATNMVTAAALAHVNRLPLLLLPGDVFANRAPDPVLQQVESFGDGTVSANDVFRPSVRYFDRITRPEQIIPALSRAMQVLTDPAECGPVTLSLCQDVQAEAFDYPEAMFEEKVWKPRRIMPDADEFARSGGGDRNRFAAGDHRRRRRALFRGDRSAAQLCRNAWRAGDGNAGRQIEPAARPSAQHGLGRRDRYVGGQRHGRRGRPHHRRRLAAAGFHHRFVGAVQERGRARSSGSTCSRSMRQAPRAAARRRRQGRARGAGARAGGLARRQRIGPPRPAEKAEVGGGGQALTDATNAELPSDMQVIGAVSRQRPNATPRLRLGRPAGRVAQALAGDGAPAATISTMAFRPWATRSPAGSASRSRGRMPTSW
jgi:hypothetical protein